MGAFLKFVISGCRLFRGSGEPRETRRPVRVLIQYPAPRSWGLDAWVDSAESKRPFFMIFF